MSHLRCSCFFCFTIVYRYIIPVIHRYCRTIGATVFHPNTPILHHSNHRTKGKIGYLAKYGVAIKAVKTDLASLKISFTKQSQPSPDTFRSDTPRTGLKASLRYQDIRFTPTLSNRPILPKIFSRQYVTPTVFMFFLLHDRL